MTAELLELTMYSGVLADDAECEQDDRPRPTAAPRAATEPAVLEPHPSLPPRPDGGIRRAGARLLDRVRASLRG